MAIKSKISSGCLSTPERLRLETEHLGVSLCRGRDNDMYTVEERKKGEGPHVEQTLQGTFKEI